MIEPRTQTEPLTSRKSMGFGAWPVKVAAGLVVGVLLMVALLREVDLDLTVRQLAGAAVLPIVLGVLVYAVDFVLRAWRFAILLEGATGRRIGVGASFGPFVASFGLNDVLPLRAGDGFRLVWFTRAFQIPGGTVLGAMIVERILDLATIVVIGGIALAVASTPAPSVLVTSFQIVAAATAVGTLVLLVAPDLIARLVDHVTLPVLAGPAARLARILRATGSAMRTAGAWRRLVGVTALSFGCWMLEGCVMVAAWISLGGDRTVVDLPFIAFVAGTLGTLLPGPPGHFGTYHYFAAQAFVVAGVDATTAAAVVVLAHLMLWLPTALYGLCWILAVPTARNRG